MGRDSKACMTIADMIISEGLPGDFAQKPKVVAAFEAYKLTSKNFKPLGRKEIDGPWLRTWNQEATHRTTTQDRSRGTRQGGFGAEAAQKTKKQNV